MSDFRINIATPNGTGSSTANKILNKILLKNNFSCSSKNLFPSNIAGLPTWYNIRINKNGYTGFKEETDLYLGFNKATFESDIEKLPNHCRIVTNKSFKFSQNSLIESDFSKSFIELPIRDLTKPLCDSPSLRKLLANLVYVGFCARLLGCDEDLSIEAIKKDLLKKSAELSNLNITAFKAGFNFPLDNGLNSFLKFDVEDFKNTSAENQTNSNYLIDGNTSAALGFIDGGASVVTWYPITPSSSLVETFDKINSKHSNKSKNVSVLQCEDEISSAVAVLGAGWSGARSFTATSGPGLSLMQEAIGLGYFSEVPMVIVDVQRAGPSTGLPTRTAQGDLLLAHYSSHGDTLHPVLLPGSMQELYDDSFQSLNIAENLQTPVIMLSDLDLGMNDWSIGSFKREHEISKGRVAVSPEDSFKRYALKDNLPIRSLPRISDKSLSYFTRGSGHDEFGNYSEDPKVYSNLLDKLKAKILNNKNLMPKDSVNYRKESEFSLIYFGSTSQIIDELITLLDLRISTYQVRSLPIKEEVYSFAKKHKTNFILEQNRDGQLYKIIKAESDSEVFKSLTQYDGLPANAKHFKDLILKNNKGLLT